METGPSSNGKPYQIVVGFDFSELGDRAIEEAIGIATRRAPSELHVVTVAEPAGHRGVKLPGDADPVGGELAREMVHHRVAEIVKEYQTRSGHVGVEHIAIYVLPGGAGGPPAQVIIDLARAVSAELIVVGTHGRTGIKRLMPGSVAMQLVLDAKCSIHVVRPTDSVSDEKESETRSHVHPDRPRREHFENRKTYLHVSKLPRMAREARAS